MKPNIDALKKDFREGRHAQAIAQAEALCSQNPSNPEIKRLCATMHAMVRNYPRALELLLQIRDPSNENPDVLFNIAMCEKELKNFEGALQYFKVFTEKFAGSADGWAGLAECKFQLGQFAEGIHAADQAIALDRSLLTAWTVRGDSFNQLGKVQEAVSDYKAALALAPGDAETLKKATICLLDSGEGHQAIQLCRDILQAHPDNITAKRGAEWILSKLVPLWHVPMMNEPARNQAFHDALATVVTPDQVVFEIGTGSGLLAMMAARLGAKKVFTCEAESLVAETAKKIVRRNNCQDQVTVLAKPSLAVQLGKDLPAKADILVHEIFSSELLGEHVLPAIEDAKARLLKEGGAVLPRAASIMVALVTGEVLGKYLHVGDSFGFDLREFNAIHPKKRPLYREDLSPELMSNDVEAFRFDFAGQSTFPAEKKTLSVTAKKAGLCYGLIQWIRIDLAEGVEFENHPEHARAISNWQHTIYGFDAPLAVKEGAVVKISAMHDRSRPWFDLA